MRDNIILTNFTAGELSPLLAGRTDISKYSNGCNTLENMIVLAHGGVTKTPGTWFVRETKDSSLQSRLIPFKYAAGQSYMIEAGEGYFRFFKDHGVVQGYDAYTKLNLVGTGKRDSTTIVDDTFLHTATSVGGAKIDTSVLFGGVGTILFDGVDDCITVPDHADWYMASGAVTIDFYVQFTGSPVFVSQGLFSQGIGADKVICSLSAGHFILAFTVGGVTTSILNWNFSAGSQLSAGVMYHFAVIRGWGGVADSWALCVDGTLKRTETHADAWPNIAAVLSVGTDGSLFFGGNMVNFRVTKGLAVWTANFVPPTIADYANGAPYEIVTPYQREDLPTLQFVQSADVMYITHNQYPVKKLSRISHNNWTLTNVMFKQADPKFITDITKANPGVVTSSSHGYDNGDTIRISEVVGMTELNGTYQTVANVTGNTYEIADTSAMTTYVSGGESVRAISDITSADPGVVTCAGHGLSNGDRILLEDITGMVELNNVYQTVANVTTDTFEIADTSAMTAYTSGGVFTGVLFSQTNDCPACCAFYEERLAFAATVNEPQAKWLSVSGDYENFLLGTDADDAMKYVVKSAAQILWLLEHDYLIDGTSDGIWRFGGEAGDPITPTNVSAKRQVSKGCSFIPGVMIDNVMLYIQKAGLKVRELSWDEQRNGYLGADITILSEHIAKGTTPATSGFLALAVQEEPVPIVWAITKEGALVGLTYMKDEQDVMGWHRHPKTNAIFESIAVIPGPVEDELWAIVKRTIGGATKRYVEYLSPIEFGSNAKDGFFVDCGLSWDGGDAVTITAATKASPVVVTAPDHGFLDGDRVYISGVVGMTELNEHIYVVVNKTAHTFQLYTLSGVAVNGTTFTLYASGGTSQKKAITFSGLTHLEGETVTVCADGEDVGTEVVASGAVTLAEYANKVSIGLGYSSKIIPMRPDLGNAMKSSQGQLKSINRISLRLFRSMVGEVGSALTKLDPIPYEDETEMFTGDVGFPFWGTSERAGDIIILHDSPLPFTLLAIIAEGETFEGD